MNVEKNAIDNPDLYDQICSCNLVRFILDDLFMYKNYDLSRLNYAPQVN